jgi:hypothetical protein
VAGVLNCAVPATNSRRSSATDSGTKLVLLVAGRNPRRRARGRTASVAGVLNCAVPATNSRRSSVTDSGTMSSGDCGRSPADDEI